MYSYFLSAYFAQDAGDVIWLVLSSTFISTAIVALIGAGGGAFFANQIATKKELKRAEEHELKAVLTALAMTSSIVNSIVQLKLQHLDKLVSVYETQRQEFLDYRAAFVRGEPRQPPEHERDFETLPCLTTPLEILQGLIYERVEFIGKRALYIAQLVQTLTGLSEAIEKRTVFIEEYKARAWKDDYEKHTVFFGVPTDDDVIDATYPTLIEGLKIQSEGSYYFSKLLHDALLDRAKELKKRLGRDKLKIHFVHFQSFEDKLVLSDMAAYSAWIDDEDDLRLNQRFWHNVHVFDRWVLATRGFIERCSAYLRS
jgi:hypothetical protein